MTSLIAPLTSPRRWALPLAISLLCLQGGCKKKNQGATQAPDDSAQSEQSTPASTETEPAKQEEKKAAVRQIPDPALLKEAAALYWKGKYEELVSQLESALPGWDAPNEQRASGLAHAWIALAHAEQLPENAQTHVESAKEVATQLEDQDVQTLADLASALSLVGMSQAEQAETLLSGLPTPQDTDLERLSHVALAKVLINLAFDERERLAHPEKLVQAEQHYRRVRPYKGPQGNAVMGHVHEGLAAIAKFRGQSKKMCDEAKKAQQAYKEGEASELLQSGPAHMMQSGGC